MHTLNSKQHVPNVEPINNGSIQVGILNPTNRVYTVCYFCYWYSTQKGGKCNKI